MLQRREFLTRTLQGSSLLALSSLVPGFVAQTAHAAAPGKDTVLVLIELTGGNDGLNTVIPYTDPEYAKVRPTLAFKKDQVVKVTDEIGLHPAMRNLDKLVQNSEVAVVQGVGYPNPDHSHFESMDIWQSADPKRVKKDGWVGRSVTGLQRGADVPVMQVGASKLALALAGGGGGVVSVNDRQAYRAELGTNDPDKQKARRRLIDDLGASSKAADDSLLTFVQRRQTETYTTLDRLQDLLAKQSGMRNFFNSADGRRFYDQNTLVARMQLVARLIQSGFGTRVFYVTIDGFDTHSGQAEPHAKLLGEVSDAIHYMFQTLATDGNNKRVLAMTFSEFGRRVHENGSRGTDHGSGSSLLVCGPGVKGGLVGKHPSLTDLDSGDLRYHTDFRRVYATLLDKWLGCDSRRILDGKFDTLDFVKASPQS